MKHKLLLTAAVLMLLMIVCSCSQVFEAGVSGTVYEEKNSTKTGIQGVNVFVFTDQSERDTEYNRALAASESYTAYTMTSTALASSTTTNANGEFTVNKVVWETKKSTYGKTADNQMVYLLFQSDDYTPAKADVMVISDSTNDNTANPTLKSIKETVTVTVYVQNGANNKNLDDKYNTRTLNYYLNNSTVKTSVSVTDTANLTMKVPKNKTDNKITFELPSIGDDDTWKMTNAKFEDDITSVTCSIDTLTPNYTLYMKRTKFIVPGFNGRIITGSSDNDYNNYEDSITDGLKLNLYYSTTSDKSGWEPLDSVRTSSISSGTSNMGETLWSHGNFSNLGSTTTNIIDGIEYDSNNKMKLWFKVENNDDSNVYRTFKYNGSSELGSFKLDGTALNY